MELEFKEAHVSPVLKDGVKNYLIDIDGTITEDIPNEEWERMQTCPPFPGVVHTINKWYDQGNKICFFTSRTENLRKVTEDWLDKNGFKYHSIIFGKPRGGNYHFIDNQLSGAKRHKDEKDRLDMQLNKYRSF